MAIEFSDARIYINGEHVPGARITGVTFSDNGDALAAIDIPDGPVLPSVIDTGPVSFSHEYTFAPGELEAWYHGLPPAVRESLGACCTLCPGVGRYDGAKPCHCDAEPVDHACTHPRWWFGHG